MLIPFALPLAVQLVGFVKENGNERFSAVGGVRYPLLARREGILDWRLS